MEIKNLLKKLAVLFVMIIFSASLFAQIYAPEGLNMPGSWNGWTNPPVNNVVLGNANQVTGGLLNNVELGIPHYQTIFSTPANIAAGTFTFLFSSGPSPLYYQNKWNDGTFTINNIENLTLNGTVDNSITLSDNMWYTMNWENIGYVDTRAIFMETSSEPVNITNVSQNPTLPAASESVTVTVTIGGVKCAEEHFYLRYSVDGWVSSIISEINFTGITGTVNIPGQISNTTVEYYVFSSVISNPVTDFDLITIKFSNNLGDNFSYIVDQQITCGSDIALISTEPPFPQEDLGVIISYNATLGNGALAGYVGDVYAHIGVITNLSSGPTDWKYVKTDWGENTPETMFDLVSADLYELNISNIRTYFGVPISEEILQIAMVTRSGEPISPEDPDNFIVGRFADGSDIYIDVYPLELNVKILSPSRRDPLASTSEVLAVCVEALESTEIDIYVDEDFITTEAGTSITYGLSTSSLSAGLHWLYATATDGVSNVTDSVPIYIRGEATVAPLPVGISRGGIYYIDDNSATLVLHDPAGYKNFAFIVGDFNEWTVCDEAYMNVTADGKFFWKTITGLTPDVEYAFQYYIDGELKIADPYSDKILDPWNDKWIPSTTYPDLMPYPNNYTTGVVSVLETGQDEYNWIIDDFTPVAVGATQSNLVVYELLIRDFVEDSDIKDVIEKLDYLQTLGVTAIELMPFNEFEGNDSWGYNPDYYFATDKGYGTKDDYKEFIDECHQRGIAVIMDMVLNHSFGLSPLVQMYWDAEYGDWGAPSTQNPWYNQIATHPYSPGYDFNHESAYTRQFCKDVMTYWLEEYKVDGFRFDLSKGFTQTNTGGDVGAWSQYDQSRVNIWQDYYNHIKSVNSDAYVILEHLSNNDEEIVLANMGCLLWGNMNTQFNENTMGWEGNDDFSWALYSNRSFTYPNLIPYMESHDEERLMFRNLEYGASGTNTVSEALQRMKAITPLYMAIPGPKMIWQFGELGYDYSINYCPDGTISGDCRTSAKPVKWDYFTDIERQELYWVYAGMIKLKTENAAFREGAFSMDLSGMGKRMWIAHTDMNVVIAANFSTSGFNMSPGFQHTGTWYDYFSGESINVTDAGGHSVFFNSGDFHVWIDQDLAPVSVNLTFNVTNSQTANPVQSATVSLTGIADFTTNIAGETSTLVAPNQDINYTVTKTGYTTASGTVNISEIDVIKDVQLVPTTSISEEDQQLVNIYPNPNNGMFTIVSGKNYIVTIYDISGRIILTDNTVKGEKIIDLSGFTNGIYLLHFSENGNSFYKKIIINK
jgi:1,4-alpha-glucan branching enzyme